MSKGTLAALAAAAMLAGCGGEDGLTKAQLGDQAGAICKDYEAKGQELGEPNLADTDEAKKYFTDAGELAQEQQDELEALKPQESLQDDYEKLTAATAKAARLLEDLAAAVGDPDKVNELVNQLTPLSAEVDAAAKAVGATDCAA